ncbi:CapA family protein [Bacillus sp. V2I10]|uniref:CapA family protein n=1 Tax=Bacillus sp. V2I10 TaxID=3042276 RepID=UPI002787263A|nr:CapA family protein [Bacillus sp. V2I10]MDQ0859553.1 poly-gamma-glutamate capsule biosynthesis protein CapA/YwtB (metallophosphatase superfamily) [Bacillus sp. V2I10]
MMKKWILSAAVLLASIGAAFFLLAEPQEDTEYPVKAHSGMNMTQQPKSFRSAVTLSAFGDILIHGRVYNDAKTGSGTYDFKPMIKDVKPLIGKSDITFANQETMIGGTEIGLSTYPSFNSPFEVVDAFQDAGVDIAGIANNHTLDRGEKAILNATDRYDEIGMPYVGSYRNSQDADTPRVINKNGVKLGFLAYTYGTNGIPVPEGKPHLVNLIDKPKMIKDIEEMKKLSDAVIVSMHWGVEYIRLPNEEQQELAKFLADQGVDLVIGHHPHVLQPMEWVEGQNGKKTFVIYSLGNFLSGQVGEYKEIGGIFSIKITKELSKGTKKMELTEPGFVPTIVVNQNNRAYRVKELKNVDQAQNKAIQEHMFQNLNEEN